MTADIIAQIAAEHMRIHNLTTSGRDSEDFHDVSVWQIERALQAAYDAGRKAAENNS